MVASEARRVNAVSLWCPGRGPGVVQRLAELGAGLKDACVLSLKYTLVVWSRLPTTRSTSPSLSTSNGVIW